MSTDINISNYEAYLYSYVDGELQPEEVQALESFLEKYPQFRAELDILLSTRLQPEAILFDHKASLYRGSEINLQNYESHLLSYIDGELDQQEKTAFEQFAARHPTVQQELKVWQATKLQADPAVRFENKSVLYRKASHGTVIRPAYWWGAAAAIMAGALFFLTLSDSTETEVIAVKQPEAQQAPAVKVPGTAGTTTAPVIAATTPKEAPQKTTASRQETTRAKAPAAAKAAANTAAVKATASNTATVNTTPAKEPATIDLANVPTEQHDNNTVIAADISKQLKKIPGNEVAANRPSIEVGTSAPLATPAPAAAEQPGELIMSVTGNGLESKVLDKVTNVARLFAKKRNK